MQIKHKFIKLWLSAAVIVLLFAGCLTAYYKKAAAYTAADSSETNTVLSNPYMGWYSLIGYTLSDSELPSVPSAYQTVSPPTELVLLEINLLPYANSDISDNGLSYLDTLLSKWSDTKKQLILRFVYDWNGTNLQSEPSSRTQIERHIEQIAPIINKYKDSVYLLQGIFVGNWGEMNHSVYLSDDDMTVLFQKLAALTDPSVFLAVRTPAQLRTILKTADPLSDAQAFSGSPASRTGLYNDGMLGSSTDTGTYGDASADTSDYTNPWPRDTEIDFQNQLCNYVPNGGEVILPNPYNDLERAISDLKTMHVSYLNKDYDSAVINQKWKTSSYSGSDPLYQGMNGFDYISCHLGYRYVLADSAFSHGKLSVTMENKGFSSCYRPLSVSITIRSTDKNFQKTYLVNTDTRTWLSGKSVTFQLPLTVQDLPSSDCTLSLKLTDQTLNREILLASDLEHTSSGYVIGTLHVNTLFSKFTK